MPIAIQGIRVRIKRTTRADLRALGSDISNIQDVEVGQELTVCQDTADALIGSGSAEIIGKMAPAPTAAMPKPAPPKGKPVSQPWGAKR